MNSKITPIKLSIEILAYLKKMGVKDIVVCPGGRNAPFVEILSKTTAFNVIQYFEERSASFFALGLCKKNEAPVVLITTSGTAVAETLPAVIEAKYQKLPLIVLSADRPKYYRGSGAPQSIEQAEMLSNYCYQSYDIDDCTDELKNICSVSGPQHINVCFDEPLLEGLDNSCDNAIMSKAENIEFDKSSESTINSLEKKADLEKQLSHMDQPVIILGALSLSQSLFVLPILKKLKIPIYAEPHSQLKGNNELSDLLIQCCAKSFAQLFAENYFKSVIRVGGVPVLRFWRDLENIKNIPVMNFNTQNLTGIPRLKNKVFLIEDLSLLLPAKTKVKVVDKPVDRKITDPLNKEQKIIEKISNLIEDDAHIFLGNSLPIREWDECAEIKSHQIYSTLRGVNGIDGNIAYFFGLCDELRTNYCIVGDLTALYDLSSGFLFKSLRPRTNFKIIILNNRGGQIFSKLFENEFFRNTHDINFKGWAEMLKLSYASYSSAEEMNLNTQVIECII